ncbi:MAG: 50S ribosomal protein L11 methyltransferase [Cellvibrionales bacterium]
MSEAGWQELRFDTTPDRVDQLESWLFAEGALAVTLEDAGDEPLLEPGPGETPLWQAITLVALFHADADTSALKTSVPPDLLDEALPDALRVPDRDWERVWMADFQPMSMGQRLWICPSWCDPPDPDAVNVFLDPGLAFGTGTHPTTALCLEALDRWVRPGITVIDYGCGSGILAVAARKLGAAAVWAVDNDPQAIVATRENAARNRLPADAINVCLPDEFAAHADSLQADLVVANILAGPLQALAPELTRCTRTGGQLILAGLLEHQGSALMAAYAPKIELSVHAVREGWVLLTGEAS